MSTFVFAFWAHIRSLPAGFNPANDVNLGCFCQICHMKLPGVYRCMLGIRDLPLTNNSQQNVNIKMNYSSGFAFTNWNMESWKGLKLSMVTDTSVSSIQAEPLQSQRRGCIESTLHSPSLPSVHLSNEFLPHLMIRGNLMTEKDQAISRSIFGKRRLMTLESCTPSDPFIGCRDLNIRKSEVQWWDIGVSKAVVGLLNLQATICHGAICGAIDNKEWLVICARRTAR